MGSCALSVQQQVSRLEDDTESDIISCGGKAVPTLIEPNLIHIVVLYGTSCSPTQFSRVAV